MPTNVIPVATWTGTIPRPDDGEGATGASLAQTAQPLANRSEYLKSQTDSVGVLRIRETGSIDDNLRGTVVTGTGDKCYVKALGLYRYDSASLVAEDLPWVVESDFGGRWIHELHANRGVYLATLASGKIPVAQIPNALIATASQELSGAGNLFFTASSTYVDATGASTSLTNVAVGDILFATLHCRAILGAAPLSAATCKLRLAYEHNGSTVSVAEVDLQELAGGTDVPPIISWKTRKVIATSFSAGTPHIFKVQLISDGTTQARLLYPFSIVIEQVRP